MLLDSSVVEFSKPRAHTSLVASKYYTVDVTVVDEVTLIFDLATIEQFHDAQRGNYGYKHVIVLSKTDGYSRVITGYLDAVIMRFRDFVANNPDDFSGIVINSDQVPYTGRGDSVYISSSVSSNALIRDINSDTISLDRITGRKFGGISNARLSILILDGKCRLRLHSTAIQITDYALAESLGQRTKINSAKDIYVKEPNEETIKRLEDQIEALCKSFSDIRDSK